MSSDTPIKKLSRRAALLMATIRALPRETRKTLLQDLAADAQLRPELEEAMNIAAKPDYRRLAMPDFVRPLDYARDTAEKTAGRLAAASYPYVLQASARLVAFSGWMANSYVKHGQQSVTRDRQVVNPVPVTAPKVHKKDHAQRSVADALLGTRKPK
jgi:hypothetical protein